jgi:hypothetical protein
LPAPVIIDADPGRYHAESRTSEVALDLADLDVERFVKVPLD